MHITPKVDNTFDCSHRLVNAGTIAVQVCISSVYIAMEIQYIDCIAMEIQYI